MMKRFAKIDDEGRATTAAKYATSFLLLWLVLFRGTISVAAEAAHAEQSATAESVKSAVAELEKLAQQTLDKTGVPGLAVAVVYDDRVVELKGFGVRQVGKLETVDADTVFQLASVSKAVTSTVLARLVGEGTIQWDDLVIGHDPGFQMYDPWVTRQLTLRDLLCHRSGLPDHAGDLVEDLGYDQAEVLHRLRYLKPASSFRSAFAYTNFGYTEAAVAAAMAAGKPWDSLAAEKLYRPLGMKETSSRYQDYLASKNRAVIHAHVDGKWVAKFNRNADAQSPAGGVSSSMRDMSQWLRLQLADGKFDGKQLIAADAPARNASAANDQQPGERSGHRSDGVLRVGMECERGRPWPSADEPFRRVRYGSRDRGVFGSVGKVGGGGPQQCFADWRAGGAWCTFCDLAIDGKPQRDWFELYRHGFEELSKPNYGTAVDYGKPPVKKLPPLANAVYVGKYANKYFGEIEVAEKDGALVLMMGPKKTVYPLAHWDRDVFTYQPMGEMAAGLSGVTFTIGPEQMATRVMIENLDVYGEGTFARVAVDQQK